MLKKLINSRATCYLYNKPAARISELKEYVCLRESLNEQAANEAAREYQSLAQKYNLSREQLTDLFRVIHLEPEQLKNYISHENYLQDQEQLKSVFALSQFHSAGKNLQENLNILKAQYPEVVDFEIRQAERAKALQTLENIFLKDGPKLTHNGDNGAVSRFLKEFESRINGHINELKNTHKHKTVDAHRAHGAAIDAEVDAVDEISRVLGVVYSKLQLEPAYVYGRIRHYLAVHGQAGKTVTKSAGPTRAELLETARNSVLSQSIEEGNDLPLIIEEANKEISSRSSYQFLPWINERKIIYEAKAPVNRVWLYSALGGVLGAYFLYKIYQGDATYAYLATIALTSGYVFTRYRASLLKSRFDYLVQLNVHRDGRHLDLFIQKANGQIAKVEGVPTTDFKLHRGDYSIEMPVTDEYIASQEALDSTTRPATSIKVSDLRRFGAARGHWAATYGEDVVLVPMDYNGNSAVLDKLFRGKNLDL